MTSWNRRWRPVAAKAGCQIGRINGLPQMEVRRPRMARPHSTIWMGRIGKIDVAQRQIVRGIRASLIYSTIGMVPAQDRMGRAVGGRVERRFGRANAGRLLAHFDRSAAEICGMDGHAFYVLTTRRFSNHTSFPYRSLATGMSGRAGCSFH